MIFWREMLLLLEGQPVHFSGLKNHYSKDVCLLSVTPVVAKSKSWVVFEPNGKSDEVGNEMMEARWKVFKFTPNSPMMSRRKWSQVEGAFLSLFYWEKFEKGCTDVTIKLSKNSECK